MRYFDTPVSKPLFHFLTARGVMILASGLLGLFLPIFLYELFDFSIQHVILYYLGTSFIYFLLLGFARFISRIGFNKSLYIAVIFLVVHYVSLFFVEQGTIHIFIPAALLAFSMFRFMFWLPFKLDTVLLTKHGSRGRQLSTLTVIQLVVSLFAPIVSALIIQTFGFDTLFLIAVVVYLVASVLFSKVEKIYETYSWGYVKTFKTFFSHVRDRKLLAYMAEGGETLVTLVVWPIFIYEVLDGNLLDVGIVASLITCFTIILQIIVGKIVDKTSQGPKFLGWGTIFYAAGWIFKAFVATAFQIFFAGAYHNFVYIFIKTPYQVFSSEIAADQGHYVDEYTVMMEMAIHFGRVLMIGLVLITLIFLPIFWVFVVAAIMSLLLNFIFKANIDLNFEEESLRR